MKRILTVGVFDYFHYGHLKLFEQAKDIVQDGYLIVAVQDESFIKKYKPEAEIFYSIETRMELIRSLKCVDEVIVYTDVANLVNHVDFDVFAIGQDQNHSGFLKAIEYCKHNHKEVFRLKRTPNISSSAIKSELHKE